MHKHGMTGQRNALKHAPDSHLHIRVKSSDKALWVKAAAPGKLSEWVVQALNDCADASLADHNQNEVE